MIKFKDSQEAAGRRIIRTAIRNGGFTRSQRDAFLAIANHWFHYKSKKFMHPSRDQIARKAKVSVRTVAWCMSHLRKAGALVVLSDLKGGQGKATVYRMCEHALLNMCGLKWVDRFRDVIQQAKEKLQKIRQQAYKAAPKPPAFWPEFDDKSEFDQKTYRAKIAHCIGGNVNTVVPSNNPPPFGWDSTAGASNA